MPYAGSLPRGVPAPAPAVPRVRVARRLSSRPTSSTSTLSEEPYVVLASGTSGVGGAGGETGRAGATGGGSGGEGDAGGIGWTGGAGEVVNVWIFGSGKKKVGVQIGVGEGVGGDIGIGVEAGLEIVGIGGKGGVGGFGGRGGVGAAGVDAEIGGVGPNGGHAGGGGSGGIGGEGGVGGRGSVVKVFLKPEDADGLMVFKAFPRVAGGEGGEAGVGGEGGEGGRGGIGSKKEPLPGSGYSAKGKDGNPGLKGAQGASGEKGGKGRDGEMFISVESLGVYGWRYDLEILEEELDVVDEGGYELLEPGCRALVRYSVRNIGGMPTPLHQDIVCSVRDSEWMQPLPSADERGFGGVALPRSLAAGAAAELSRPVHMWVANMPRPAVGAPFAALAEIDHVATVTRVDADFERVDQQMTSVALRFAVEMEALYGQVCAVEGGEAFVGLRVKNVSEKAVGMGAAVKRALQLRLLAVDFEKKSVLEDEFGLVVASLVEASHVEGADVLPVRSFEIAEVGSSFLASHPGMVSRVDMLEPGEVRVVGCAVRMTKLGASGGGWKASASPPRGDGSGVYETIAGAWSESVNEVAMLERLGKKKRSSRPEPKAVFPGVSPSFHSQALLQAVLDLGHPRDLLVPRSVQARPFEVQLAEPFEYKQGVSKVLLIVNNRTTAAEVDDWRLLAGRIYNTEDWRCVSVYNISLYGGVSLVDGDGLGGRSLAQLFSGKGSVIVFLNNKSAATGIAGTREGEICPMERLQQQELLRACRDHGCRIYVYGAQAGADLYSRLQIPVLESGDNVRVEEFIDEATLASQSAARLRPRALFHSFYRESRDDFSVVDDSGSDTSFPTMSMTGTSAEALALTEAAWMRADIKGYLLEAGKSGRGKPRFCAIRGLYLSVYPKENSKVPKHVYNLADCVSDHGARPVPRADSIYIHFSDFILELSEITGKKGLKFESPPISEWRKALAVAYRTGGPADPTTSQELIMSGRMKVRGVDCVCTTQVLRRRSGEVQAVLKSRAESVAHDLQLAYPEASWCVVYGPPPAHSTLANAGILNKRSVGEITVRMGLVHDGGNVVTNWYDGGDDDSGHFVHGETFSERNVYGFIKALSLPQKLKLLQNSSANGSLGFIEKDAGCSSLALLVDAIASDCADENALFRFGSVSATAKVATTVSKKRAVEAETWARRMTVLSSVVNSVTFASGTVEVNSAKFAELFRLLATLRLLIQRSLPLRESTIKATRCGLIARAATILLDRLTLNVADGAGVEKASALKNAQGQSVDKAVSSMTKDGLGGSNGRIGRHDVLALLRCRRGVGVLGSNSKLGLFEPVVMSSKAYQAVKESAASSAYPFPFNLEKTPGSYANESDRRAALDQFLSSY